MKNDIKNCNAIDIKKEDLVCVNDTSIKVTTYKINNLNYYIDIFFQVDFLGGDINEYYELWLYHELIGHKILLTTFATLKECKAYLLTSDFKEQIISYKKTYL